jgi:hypothetical protein
MQIPLRSICTGYLRAFTQAYAGNTKILFYTSGNQTPFTVSASFTTRGMHKGEPVLIFRTNAMEKARSCQCYWGHITNCGRTYIDCYTSVLTQEYEKP